MDRYGFYTGQSFDAYEYLGAHDVPTGTVFRTFAPNAAGVCVVYGESGSVQEMRPICDVNFYEAYIEGIGPGTPYEYRIYLRNGQFVDHCDPCGFGMELRPQHRSIVRSLSGYKFRDAQWMEQREDCLEKPLNIYEMHLGSWKKSLKPQTAGTAMMKSVRS